MRQKLTTAKVIELISLPILAVISLMAIALVLTPASTFMTARVKVPDFRLGDPLPTVDYSRSIKLFDREMAWRVESVHDNNGVHRETCKGSGVDSYAAGTSSLPLRIDIYSGVDPEFAARKCAFTPGLWRTKTCWSFHVLWFPKRYCAWSNPFRVSPKPS